MTIVQGQPQGTMVGLMIRCALAAAVGALAVLAFAPFSAFPVSVLALAAFYELVARSKRGGLLIGWSFGLGLMGVGVSWIRISMNEFGEMDTWLANLLTVLFVLVVAAFYGLIGWVVQRLANRRTWAGPLLVLPGVWLLVEWLRGWLFTGFPWLAMGYSQIESPLAGYAPILGVYGLSGLVALAAGLTWGLVRWPGWWRTIALAALVVLWSGGFALSRVAWTQVAGSPFRASVLQASIPQSIKWNPERRVPTLTAYLELTRANWSSEVIVWPETAIPDFLERMREPFLDPLAAEARDVGAELLIGIAVLDRVERRYYNGLVSIGSTHDLYLKRHLVPFGEYVPFERVLGPLARAFDVPMPDFSSGPDVRPLLRAGRHLVGASICYEDTFPEEVIEALPEAHFLVNVSNDAWFGDSLAPRQHLEIARMRALETGRWLLRSTNTGISAIIDNHGEIVGTVPTFERGAFSAEIEARTGATPFVLVGNRLAVGIGLALLALVVVTDRVGRRFANTRV